MVTRALFLLALCAYSTNANVKKHVLGSTQVVPFEMGGAQITFPGVQIGEEALLRCLVSFPGGGQSISVVPSVPYDRNSAICRLPPDVYVGTVNVDLEVNDTSSVVEMHSGTFLINPDPNTAITVEEDWQTNEVSFSWDPEYFNQFFAPGTNIIIQASLYNSINGEPIFGTSGVLLIVGNNGGNGKATVSAANLEKISNFAYPYFYTLRPVGTQSGVYLSSRLFSPTLGMSEGFARDICQSWVANATGPPNVGLCPPCLCKAKLDGDFVQSEYQPQIVQLAAGQLANHVLYYQQVPTDEGHAQTCSYNTQTDALANTSPAQAGWVHLVSKDVSYVENYFADIWPFIVCCMQSNSAEFCQMFHDKRPFDTGHNYPGPDDPCYGTGDPHMSTFDGVRYDFMGFGEFWLIKGPAGSGFGVQGRMSPIAPDQKVSYYRALAMRDGSTSIQLQYKGPALQILVNGVELEIPPQGLSRLPLDTISLTVSPTRVVIRFRTGFTITVDYYTSQVFNVYGGGAHDNRGKGYMGIFGLFDADPENDLTSQDGFIIPPTAENLRNLSLIHNVFGLSWATTEQESFFVYDEGYTWANHSNPAFGPIDTYPNPEEMSDAVRAICGTSLACYYEYVGTGELKDAEDTVGAEQEHDELVEEIAKKIPMCDTIPAPANGRVSAEGYLNGSVATYSCHDEYEIIDEAVTRTCVAVEEEATWTGAEPTCVWTCTRCPGDAEYLLAHDPSDCTKFFLCSNGDRYPLECPAGEVFNRETLVCDGEYECPDPGC